MDGAGPANAVVGHVNDGIPEGSLPDPQDLLLPTFCAWPVSFLPIADFTCLVAGTTGGDTVWVMRDGAAVKIRLHGINGPESRHPFGTESKTFLSGVSRARQSRWLTTTPTTTDE